MLSFKHLNYITFYLIFFLGKQVVFFQVFYHLLICLMLGLTKSEYRYLLFIFFISSFLFFLSSIFFKKFLFPFTWNFLLSFKDFAILKSLTLHFEAKLLDYVTFFIDFYFSCLIYFQFFLFPFFFNSFFQNRIK